jgi:hypothetical protein
LCPLTMNGYNQWLLQKPQSGRIHLHLRPGFLKNTCNDGESTTDPVQISVLEATGSCVLSIQALMTLGSMLYKD